MNITVYINNHAKCIPVRGAVKTIRRATMTPQKHLFFFCFMNYAAMRCCAMSIMVDYFFVITISMQEK